MDEQTSLVEERDDLMGLLAFWSNVQRESIQNLIQGFNIRKTQGVVLSSGLGTKFSNFLGQDWNLSLLLKGLLPTPSHLSVDPLALRFDSLQGELLGSCEEFSNPNTVPDLSCELKKDNFLFNHETSNNLTLIFDE